MRNDPTITAPPADLPRCAVVDCGQPAVVTISSRTGGGITPFCITDAAALFRASCYVAGSTTIVTTPIAVAARVECASCGRTVPESEARAGYTTCEYCGVPDEDDADETPTEPTVDEVEVTLLGPADDRTVEIGVLDPYEPGWCHVHAATLSEGQARELHAKLGALLETTGDRS